MNPDSFERLSAEHERAWLGNVYVLPEEFSAMASARRPIIVFGESGTGRSALRLQLAHRAAGSGYIAVDWQPAILEGIDGSPTHLSRGVSHFVWQGVQRCVAALLPELARQPYRLRSTSGLTKESLAWLLGASLGDGLPGHLRRLKREYGEDAIAPLEKLGKERTDNVLFQGASDDDWIAELTGIAADLGFSGFWLMLDDALDTWLTLDAQAVTSGLNALLASLDLFERGSFVPKLFVPAPLAPLLRDGRARDRLDQYWLVWKSDQIQEIIRLRLVERFGNPAFGLADLCEQPDELLAWLQEYGGSVPRGWLKLLRPIVDAYSEKETARSLTRNEVQLVLGRHPPKLRVEPPIPGQPQRRAFQGYREISSLTPTDRRLLAYLYDHYPRPCSRVELFFRVCEGAAEIPDKSGDSAFTLDKAQNSRVDMALSRLRAALKPKPKKDTEAESSAASLFAANYVTNDPRNGYVLAHVE